MHHSALPAASISHPILPLLHHPISSLLTYSLISLTLHIKQSHQTLSLHPLIPLNSFYLPLLFHPYSHNNLTSISHPTLLLLLLHFLTPLSHSAPFLNPILSLHSPSHNPLSPFLTPLSHTLLSLFLPTLSHHSRPLSPFYPTPSTPALHPLLPHSPPCNLLSLLLPSHSSLPPLSHPTILLHSPSCTPLSLHSPPLTLLFFFTFPLFPLSPLLYSPSLTPFSPS